MKIHRVVQGSSAWLALRVGRPTSSQFDRIITPKGNATAESTSQKYINEILAELILGRPLDNEMTALMNRGSEMEAEARRYYEFVSGRTDITEIGFCTTDDGRVGASPDGMVGDDGQLEIKCPKAETHVGYLFSTEGVAGAYKPQVQGQLYVCEREWCDTISYYPGMPEALIRTQRDEQFIATLRDELEGFLCRLGRGVEVITARGWIKQPEAIAEDRADPLLAGLEITDEDIEVYLKEVIP
jgi:hypothetical protein